MTTSGVNTSRHGRPQSNPISVHLRSSLFLFFLFASTTHATDIQITARPEPPAVTIGTPFRYVVDITAPADTELVLPLLGDSFGEFRVVDFGEEPPRLEDGRLHARRWFGLVGYATGDRALPPYPIKYRAAGEEELGDAEAPATTVIVESLLPRPPATPELRDIASPEEAPRDWRPWLLGAAGVAAAAALVALLYWLAGRRRAAAVESLPKPHEVALQALARLRARHLLEAERYEEYYVELSAIVRTYVEGRFGLHAPEMTTEEFLAVMQRDHRLGNEHRALLGEFLTESDLVKFARHTPTPEDGERGFAAARRFVEESRPLAAVEEERRAPA